MSKDLLLIKEIFHSLQGETSLIGVPFAFVRLSGCNLRCVYCDSVYAFKGGTRMRISEVIQAIAPYGVKHVLLTGGEPLLQRPTPDLAQALQDAGYKVSIETHGEVTIEKIRDHARVILDIKTPGSKMCRGGYLKNLPLLKPGDEVKFVICEESDWPWALDLVHSKKIPPYCEILMSPALPHPTAPGTFGGVEPSWLAQKILDEKISVRFQLQLHKALGLR